MLWRDYRLNDAGNIVNIWKRFHAEKDIVEGDLGRLGGFFRSSHDCVELVKPGSFGFGTYRNVV